MPIVTEIRIKFEIPTGRGETEIRPILCRVPEQYLTEIDQVIETIEEADEFISGYDLSNMMESFSIYDGINDFNVYSVAKKTYANTEDKPTFTLIVRKTKEQKNKEREAAELEQKVKDIIRSKTITVADKFIIFDHVEVPIQDYKKILRRKFRSKDYRHSILSKDGIIIGLSSPLSLTAYDYIEYPILEDTYITFMSDKYVNTIDAKKFTIAMLTNNL